MLGSPPRGEGPGERVLLALLLFLLLAPACAPPDLPPADPPRRNLVVLTDTTQWPAPELAAYRDSLATAGYRVLVSGYPGETAAELTARLPWLLQPGVDVFIYDERLAGSAGRDSLKAALQRLGSPAIVQ